MKLYNLKGEVLKFVKTKSGNEPGDIHVAVIRRRGLVYADLKGSCINLVRGTQKQTGFKQLRKKSKTKILTLIILRGWIPCGLCSTSSGDLLVIARSDDDKETKVVRYSAGSKEKQSIQWDDQGKPLYSSYGIKYLSENKNLDICLADCGACAVVVVSAFHV